MKACVVIRRQIGIALILGANAWVCNAVEPCFPEITGQPQVPAELLRIEQATLRETASESEIREAETRRLICASSYKVSACNNDYKKRYGHGQTEVEGMTLTYYIIGGNRELNRALYAHDPAFLPVARTLTRAIEKFPRYVGKVLRGTTLPSAVLAQHQPGKIIQYDAFISTGKDYSFGGDQSFIIYSKNGRDLLGSPEDEVLFPPGTKFKILDRKRLESGVTQFIMEEVD